MGKISPRNNMATRRSAKEALKNSPGKTRGSSHFWNWSRKNRRTLPVSRGRSARKLEIRFFLGHISRQNSPTTTKQSTGRVSSHNGPVSEIKSNEVDEWKIPPPPLLAIATKHLDGTLTDTSNAHFDPS